MITVEEQISKFLKDFPEKLDSAIDEILIFADTKITAGAIKNMQDTGVEKKRIGKRPQFIFSPRSPNDQGPLRLVTSRLARSLTGALFNRKNESIRKFKVLKGIGTLIKGSKVPHASINEFGGIHSVIITPKMRSFFWFMHAETGEEKFKAMALTKKTKFTIKIPARPYLGPAGESSEEDIFDFAGKTLANILGLEGL